MNYRGPYFCADCGKQVRTRRELSRRSRCKECAMLAAVANAVELHVHSGPNFDHWRRRSAAALGIQLDVAPTDGAPS